MSMYCRITGKSRGLPKPNYFPLLPPISPADAKKLCRITGRTCGLPTSHQYIPIPLKPKQKASQICPVTGKSLGQPQHHFIPELPGKSSAIRHLPVAGYRYVVPVLDPPPPALQEILAGNVHPDSIPAQYVYTLDEKSCGLVVPGNIEAAVRLGTVSSMSLADNKEKLAIKLLEGTQITIRVKEMTVQPTIDASDIEIPENIIALLDGQGPTAKAVKIVEKKKKKAVAKAKKKVEEMELMKKVFVEKELKAEKEELDSIIEKKAEVKIKSPEVEAEINGILKRTTDNEVVAPKVAKKVSITGDEKIKVLQAIKEIYMSNGEVENDDDDVSEIEHFKPNASTGKRTDGHQQLDANRGNVSVGGNHARQLGEAAQSDGNVRPVTEANEKLIKQATNEKIKTSNKMLNGQISKCDAINGEIVTSFNQGTTENIEVNMQHSLSEKDTAVALPGVINTHASRENTRLTDTAGQTRDVLHKNAADTAQSVSENTCKYSETSKDHKSEGNPNICEKSLMNGTEKLNNGVLDDSLSPLHGIMTSQAKIVNGNELNKANVCSGNLLQNENTQISHANQQENIANGANNIDISTLSSAARAIRTENGDISNLSREINNENKMDTEKHTARENKLKTEKLVPEKQLYKSNGTAVQLTVEPWTEEAKHRIKPDEHLTPLPEPITIPPCSDVNVEACEPGVVHEQPSGVMLRTSVSLPPAPATCANQCPKTPDVSVLRCVWEIAKHDPEELAKTANAAQVLQPKHADKVATLQDILKLTKNLDKGTDATLKWGDDVLHGKNVYINREKSCFVPGLKVNGNFIPGQTIDSEFVAGLTVKTVSKIGLIPGCVMNDGGFVAGINKEGKFISGQIFNTGEKDEFVPGQTIMTPDGPRFVPGQVADEQFLPGIIVNTLEGPKFVHGQLPEPGDFRPGVVCHKAETGQPVFIPGQAVTEDGDTKFVPGRTLATPQGSRFVPGREVTDGKNIFVPGITENNDFIPGTVIKTPSGEKFVEGRVVMSYNGKTRFVPGTTEHNVFTPVKDEAELKIHKAPEKKVAFIQDVSHSNVYGHMIQKANDVQFYPEGSILPSKGVIRSIPGQLVKYLDDDEEPSFVPGMMVDSKFVAGQMVRTAEGTKFVPGQLVKNKMGAKFVPGQTLDDGQFVPGQVVNDKFVPGQIVQTAAGPTFIPGQVISTPEEGSRFVPGRVVETSQGPHFVPGRVIEDGQGGVSFVPGRVVDTGDGPRFVAPDLESSPDGTMQYSMQSFEVSPEELQLIDQQNCRDEVNNIDSTMFHQLARAGISIAKKSLPDVYICPVKNLDEIATHITDRLKLPEEAYAKMTEILQKAAELGHTVKKCEIKSAHKPEFKSDAQANAFELIESAVRTAMTKADKNVSLNPGEAIVQELGSMLQDSVPQLGIGANADYIVNALYEIVSSPATLEAITMSVQQGLKRPVANKVEVFKDIINKSENLQDTVKKISTVLRKPKNQLDIGRAFKRISVGDPELVDLVVSKVGEKIATVNTEKQAASTLQNSIVSAVRESSERQILNILDNADISGLKHLIMQAVGLARALGLDDAAEELTSLHEDTRLARALAKDRTALEILQRLTLMKKLSESRPAHAEALGNLSSSARKEDTRYLKQLVRESEALLTAVHEEDDSVVSEDEDYSYTNSSFNSTFDDEIINRVPFKIKSSHDIPAALFHALIDCQKPAQLLHKLLSAIGEDRLYSYDHACVILKNNIQAVIPKESSRSVLTGKASYTLIDEKGVRLFGAMDVFSALKISKPIALRHFSVYTSGLESTWGYAKELAPVVEDDTEPITEADVSTIPPDNTETRDITESNMSNDSNFSLNKKFSISSSQSDSLFESSKTSDSDSFLRRNSSSDLRKTNDSLSDDGRYSPKVHFAALSKSKRSRDSLYPAEFATKGQQVKISCVPVYDDSAYSGGPLNSSEQCAALLSKSSSSVSSLENKPMKTSSDSKIKASKIAVPTRKSLGDIQPTLPYSNKFKLYKEGMMKFEKFLTNHLSEAVPSTSNTKQNEAIFSVDNVTEIAQPRDISATENKPKSTKVKDDSDEAKKPATLKPKRTKPKESLPEFSGGALNTYSTEDKSTNGKTLRSNQETASSIDERIIVTEESQQTPKTNISNDTNHRKRSSQ